MNIKIKVAMMSALLMCGCVHTDHEKIEQGARIDIAEQRNDVLENELNTVKNKASAFSYGVGKALEKEQMPSLAVRVAIQLNERVKILLGNPSYDEMIKTGKMIEELTSAVEKDRQQGEKILKEKDKEIFKTNEELTKLREKYDSLEKEYKDTAEKAAVDADKYGVVVKQVNSWFGIGGIIYGVKRLGMWLLIFGGVFMILRFASTFSPIASAIFGAFEGVVGAIIKVFGTVFSWIIPKAVQLGGFVTHEVFNKANKTNQTMIDIIQEMKLDQEKHPEKIYTINDLLTKFGGIMSDTEKDQVEKALVELKWKKD